MKNIILQIFCFLIVINLQASPPAESDFYKIVDIQIPEDIALEVGGIAFNDKGELGAITRRGELWLIKNPTSKSPKYIRFAHGLHEPLGLSWKDGSFYCAQRGELTKLTDKNNDDKADSYESIYSWKLDGNYHEYSYGPVFSPEGDMIVTLNLGWIGRGASLSQWGGWMIRITEDGKMTPFATGMRSPAGFGFNKNGDIFYTENQGDWVGSGRMTHVEKGDFVGNPEGLKWTGEPNSPLKLKPEDIDESKGLTLYEYSKEIDAIKPPSVWFPHTLMGISTSDISEIKKGFGPYEGQLLVGDQGHSKIMRVYQEKVNGVYQGACFPFVEGFSSGLLRLEWAPDQKSIYAGMTSRGWASTGRKSFGLQRLTWTGKTSFEMKTINVTANGFEITFTKPVDENSVKQINAIKFSDFTYKYHSVYGSPVTDLQDRTVKNIEVSEDGLRVKIEVDQLRPGYIYEIKTEGVHDEKKNPALHNVAYYTLNEIPGTEARSTNEVAANKNNKEENTSSNNSTKNQNTMPDTWEKVEANLFLSTKPGLKFDKELIKVKAGTKIKLTFENPDDMLHNFVLTKRGKVDIVSNAANNLGLKGEAQNYVPDISEVLFHTRILQPLGTEIIYFEAPTVPGDYPYVCTFPGHSMIMRGILKVE